MGKEARLDDHIGPPKIGDDAALHVVAVSEARVELDEARDRGPVEHPVECCGVCEVTAVLSQGHEDRIMWAGVTIDRSPNGIKDRWSVEIVLRGAAGESEDPVVGWPVCPEPERRLRRSDNGRRERQGEGNGCPASRA